MAAACLKITAAAALFQCVAAASLKLPPPLSLKPILEPVKGDVVADASPALRGGPSATASAKSARPLTSAERTTITIDGTSATPWKKLPVLSSAKNYTSNSTPVSSAANITSNSSRNASAVGGGNLGALKTTAATCASLQNRIHGDLGGAKLKDVSCTLLGHSDTSRARACECRLLRTTATGGACPYDCASSGVPACVDGAAKDLGLTGLTSSTPLPVPMRTGFANLEAFTCTYWRWSLDPPQGPTSDDEERARLRGRKRFADMLKEAAASVEPAVESKMQKLIKQVPATFSFESSLENVSDGGPHAWANTSLR